jgi:transcriptional regulator with XRE-family HTH domain
VLSDTLAEGLARYAIGEKLRALRLKKKMGLVELSRHTGLSAAMLSKVERGKLFPTLPTLLRIALVFSVGLEYFFSDDARRSVSRSAPATVTFLTTSSRWTLRPSSAN